MKTSDFVISVVDHAMEDPPTAEDEKKAADGEYNPLGNSAESNLQKMYNGDRPVSAKNAAIILKHLDKQKFEDWVQTISQDGSESLRAQLEAVGIVTTAYDLPSTLATMLGEILEASATKNKKVTEAMAPVTNMVSNVQFSELAKRDIQLLLETDGYCPNDNCAAPLFGTRNGRQYSRYKIAKICSSMPDQNGRNLIALCPDCYDAYVQTATPVEVDRLLQIKQDMLSDSFAADTVSNIKLEDDVRSVIQRITSADDEKLVPLTYIPVEVKKKILPENRLLLRKTLRNVTTYFNFVKDLFKQMGKEGTIRYDSFAAQVKLGYLKLRDSDLSQEQIYTTLVDWLAKSTNGNRDACEVVISYFVQNCEVFDAIT